MDLDPCSDCIQAPATRGHYCDSCADAHRRSRFQVDDDPNTYEDATDEELAEVESDWQSWRLR